MNREVLPRETFLVTRNTVEAAAARVQWLSRRRLVKEHSPLGVANVLEQRFFVLWEQGRRFHGVAWNEFQTETQDGTLNRGQHGVHSFEGEDVVVDNVQCRKGPHMRFLQAQLNLGGRGHLPRSTSSRSPRRRREGGKGMRKRRCPGRKCKRSSSRSRNRE